MARRYYSSTAQRTTLASSVNDSSTTLSVTSVSGWPSSFPYTLIIDQDTINEEIVEVTARSGTTLTVTRGVDGTTGVAHDAGAAVNHGVSARDFDEPNAFINGTDFVSTDGGSTVEASGASVVPLVLKGASGQTANLLTVEDSTGTDITVLDENGWLGIGTDNPAYQIEIVAPNGSNGNMRIRGGATAGDDSLLRLQNQYAGGENYIYFGDTDDSNAGQIIYDHDTDHMAIGVNAGERMRLTSGGSVLIGTTTEGDAGAGDLVVDGGIFLGGSTTANKLDDYEEGTWTPEYTFSTSGSVTHDIQSGDYMRINRKVFIHVRIRTDAVSSPTGDVRISGLPFNTTGTISLNYGMGGVVTRAASFGDDFPSTVTAENNSVDYVVLRFRNAADGATSTLQGSDMGTAANNNDLEFNAWYWASA